MSNSLAGNVMESEAKKMANRLMLRKGMGEAHGGHMKGK